MGKNDIKFSATLIAVISAIAGLMSHGVLSWSKFEPSSAPAQLTLDIAQWTVYGVTALWILAIGMMAKVRGLNPLWGFCGVLMLVPVIGLLPWVVVALTPDRNPNLGDALLTPQKQPLGHLEPSAVRIRYSSEAMERDANAYTSVEKPYDPWRKTNEVASKPKPPTQTHRVVGVGPKVVRTDKYNW